VVTQEDFAYNAFVSRAERDEIFREHAATTILEELVIYNNGPVYSLVGNANNPNLQEDIMVAKGTERGRAPVAWTVPFDHEPTRGIFKTNEIIDPHLRGLLEDRPDELTRRIGAVAFMRGPADMERKTQYDLPDCIIPNVPNAAVQIYSPVGNPRTEALISEIIRLGGEPVMTSANLTNSPEITDEADMLEYKKHTGLRLLHNILNSDDPWRVRSSYPIYEYVPEGLRPVRSGCIDLEIQLRLMDGYAFAPFDSTTLPKARYPRHILHMSSLPETAQSAKGEELRKYVLESLGVHAE